MFNLCVSHRLRQPISVLMYQPLKGAAVNWMPPQSNIMLETAGSAYHLSPSSSNQSKLKEEVNDHKMLMDCFGYVRRVAQRYFQNVFRRNVEVVGVVSVGRQHQGQQVPSGAGAFPSQFLAHFGELDVQGVANDGTVGLTIAGVAQKLLVPHSEVVLSVGALREYCYGGAAKEHTMTKN